MDEKIKIHTLQAENIQIDFSSLEACVWGNIALVQGNDLAYDVITLNLCDEY